MIYQVKSDQFEKKTNLDETVWQPWTILCRFKIIHEAFEVLVQKFEHHVQLLQKNGTYIYDVTDLGPGSGTNCDQKGKYNCYAHNNCLGASLAELVVRRLVFL
jgi:hypothetical protein